MNQRATNDQAVAFGLEQEHFGRAIWINKTSVKPQEDGPGWTCFHQEFALDQEAGEALLSIAADYRYAVWLNGEWIGQGPVRGWPDEVFYDTYEVEASLKPGTNSIAVLLHTVGTGTFQYIPGTEGIIVRIAGKTISGSSFEIVTGTDWLCLDHPSYSRRTPRISCQQGYVEHFDALLEPLGWREPLYRPGEEWETAGAVTNSGLGAETKLIPRDIPLLTEDEMYPLRIRSISRVRLPEAAWSFDIRPWLLPGIVDSNPHEIWGMVVTNVFSQVPAEVRLHLQDRTSGLNVKLMLNGQAMEAVDDTGAHWSGLYHYDIQLRSGSNLLVFWFDGTAHDFTFQVGLEGLLPGADLGIVDPALPELSEGRFACWKGERGNGDNERYEKLKRASGWAEWAALAAEDLFVIPLQWEHEANVFHRMVHARVIDRKDLLSGEVHACCGGNREYTRIEPTKEANEAVQLVFEFEKMTSGLIEFEIYGHEGAIFDWYGFETYRGDQPVHMHSMHNTMRYVSREGWQTYRSFIPRAFRYLVVQVSGCHEAVKIRHVRCLLRTYPSPAIGHFRCSDESLNQIYEMSRWTARLCSDDVFVDCPTYEQAFWVGDAYVMSGVQSTLSGAYPLIRRSLLLAAQSMRRSPIVESQVPSAWENVLSTWSLLWAMACEEFVRNSGDLEFAERIYPYVLQQTRYYRDSLTDPITGLIRSPYWNLLDWAPMDCPAPAVVTHVNALYVRNCRSTAIIADYLGEPRVAQEMRTLADEVARGINVYLWDPARQAYADCLKDDMTLSSVVSEQTQIMCDLGGVVPPDRQWAVERYLTGVAHASVTPATPFMRYFRLQAFEKSGMYGDVLREIREIWGYMLEEGGTTCWEDMPGRWAPGYPTRSYCHGWSVAPSHFLPRIALGIGEWTQEGKPELTIAPQSADVGWAHGGVQTTRGEVLVRWEKTEREFTISLRLPTGVSGKVRLPVPPYRIGQIKVDGKVLDDPRLEDGGWVCRIAGGEDVSIRASVRGGWI